MGNAVIDAAILSCGKPAKQSMASALETRSGAFLWWCANERSNRVSLTRRRFLGDTVPEADYLVKQMI
ncbi:MAG: hypothetical protein V9E89_15245 [Ilumatobacteraceae bacterium]